MQIFNFIADSKRRAQELSNDVSFVIFGHQTWDLEGGGTLLLCKVWKSAEMIYPLKKKTADAETWEENAYKIFDPAIKVGNHKIECY